MGIKAKQSDFIFVVLHDSIQNIPTAQDIFGSAVASLRAPDKAEQRLLVDLAVDTVRTVRLGTEEVPCTPERAQERTSRLLECLESKFEEHAGCALPWTDMRTTGHKKICSNDTDMLEFEEYLMEMIEKASFTNIYKKTGCIHSCEQMVDIWKYKQNDQY